MKHSKLNWCVLLAALVLPLTALATDVTVADANGNELTYSYDTADGPATFKAVKTYASDASKAGRIIIADAITDANGVSHQVLYVNGSVGNRSNLVSVVFGKNIVAVGGPNGTYTESFRNCQQLVSVTLNAKVQILGPYAFRDCAALTTINLSAATSLTTIKYECFEYCHALTSVSLPASLTSIENYGFYQCNNLQTVTFAGGSGSLTLGNQVFFNCDRLKTVSLPGHLTAMGEKTFDNCDSLRSCVFNGTPSITTIPYNTFAGCKSLETMTLPDAVETIGTGVFYGCESLTEITFGTGLTSLGDDWTWCGYYMANLQKLTFPGPNYPFTRSYALNGGVTLFVNADLVDTYRTNDYTKAYHIVAIGQPTTATVTTTAGGQLEAKVMAKGDPTNMLELTVSGPLNGTDINFLHQQMWGLQKLDLTNASIVAGGDSYARWHYDNNTVTQNGSTLYATEANVVGNFMFYDMPQLRSLKLPTGTTAIGEYAICQERDHGNRFYLSECPIPSGVKTIGRNAFYYTGITEVTVPSGVTTLEREVFLRCEKLKSVSLPQGLKVIGHGPFSDCYALETVNLPSTVESIGDYAFFNNKVRSNALVIPAACKSIGSYAFRYNYALPSVTFNEGLESIGYCCFSQCTVATFNSLPSTITSLGEWTFEYCEGITQFTAPANLTTIPTGLLYTCPNLERATLATGTTRINSQAFQNCPKLAAINLSSQTSLTYIGNSAFQNTGFTTVTVPNSITDMGYSAFRECKELVSINVPTGMDYVPYDYVCYCPKFTTVTMHNGIRRVGHNAFLGCPLLQSITLNDQITTIEYDAFNGCTSLVLTKLPAALTSIGQSAFKNTTSITGTLTIPDGVTSIGSYAFQGCGISAAIVPDNFTTFGVDGIFRGCKSLTSVKLPANLTRIPNYTFMECSALQQISLPATITEIGWGAFSHAGLTSVTLPEGIYKIESYAFEDTQLQTFRVPDGFTDDLGSYALSNCKRLKSVYFGRNQDYSQWSDFTCCNGCDSLELMRVYAGTPPKCNTYYMGYRTNCVLEVPEEQIEAYAAATGWKDFKEIRGFFMGDVLREQDYALMQALYQQLGGANWKNKWDLTNDHHAVGKWNGVTTKKVGGDSSLTYAITAIDLSGQGLTGQLPASLFQLTELQTLNLSNNKIAANLSTLLAVTAAAPLTEVNLQGNQLTGDLYAFASKLPTLTKLDVSYNRLTDISQPIAKDKLSSGNLTYNCQFIDYATKQVVAPAGAPVTDLTAGVAADIPLSRLVTYRHDSQDYGYSYDRMTRIYYDGYWRYEWELHRTDGLWALDNGSDNYVLKAKKDTPTAYALNSGNNRTILLRFTWDDGDANADQTVDVTDLQSVVYYALNDRKPAGQMFNYSCADTNGDDKINVSDIVGTVDYVLAYESPAGSRARVNNMVDDSNNLLTVNGSSLVLSNSEPVAALQLDVAACSSRRLRVNDALAAQFTVAVRDMGDGVRIVVYSTSGRTLAAGEHELISDLPAGATVTDVCLSDVDARHLGVRLIGETTAVPSVALPTQQTGQVYDLSGRRVGPWNTLPKGIYVIDVNGKQYKVKK